MTPLGYSAVFWRKVILVPNVILRYGGLKGFFFGRLVEATPEILKWGKYKVSPNRSANEL